jgi:hypothetical protein
MSKAQRIILPTIIGVLIGIISMLFQPVYNIYRFQLNHDENNLKENQNVWFEDRIFVLPNDLMARSYSSYNEKLLKKPVPQGLITEVKVYLPNDQNKIIAFEGVEQQAKNTTTKILNSWKQGEVREWLTLISWSLFGFFIGLLLNYIHFLFVGKTKNNEQEHSQLST